MADQSVLALVVLLLCQLPQPVVNGFDEDAQRRTVELEQATPEPPDPAWGALLAAALQQWPFMAAAEALLLPLCLWFRRRRAARKQRAAARRAREDALRHEVEIERRRLLFKRRYKDMKEMWKTMKIIGKVLARFFRRNRKKTRMVKMSSAGF